jgi:plasmid maintenance system antidote protein VapI
MASRKMALLHPGEILLEEFLKPISAILARVADGL